MKKFQFAKFKWQYLAALALLLLLFANGGFRSLARNAMELMKLNRQKAELEAEKVTLQRNFKTVKDRENIEKAARVELGLAKPGEIEYRFTPPTSEEKDK